MRRFDLRIEQPDGQVCDTHVSAEDLPDARKRMEGLLSNIKNWQWRGAIAFVNGATPAEERIAEKQKRYR